MVVRALKLQLAGGEIPVGALQALVRQKRVASMVNGVDPALLEVINTRDDLAVRFLPPNNIHARPIARIARAKLC
jgi:hypothetical protein